MSAGRYAWMDSALCAQADPDTWTETGPGSGNQLPKQICASCPVRAACAAHAQQIHTYDGLAPTGIWGGAGQRRRTTQRRQAA